MILPAPADGTADGVARRINDAGRIGGRPRRLDQHPFRAVAVEKYKPFDRWADHADLVAQNLVARAARLDQHSLHSVAAR